MPATAPLIKSNDGSSIPAATAVPISAYLSKPSSSAKSAYSTASPVKPLFSATFSKTALSNPFSSLASRLCSTTSSSPKPLIRPSETAPAKTLGTKRAPERSQLPTVFDFVPYGVVLTPKLLTSYSSGFKRTRSASSVIHHGRGFESITCCLTSSLVKGLKSPL